MLPPAPQKKNEPATAGPGRHTARVQTGMSRHDQHEPVLSWTKLAREDELLNW